MDLNSNLLKNININYSALRKVLGAILCILFSALIISYDFLHMGEVKSGDVVPVTIKAPRDFVFVDESRTKYVEKIAQESIEKIYTFDSKVLPNVIKNLQDFFKNIEERKVESIKNTNLKELADIFKTLGPYRLFEMKTVIIDRAEKILKKGYKKEDFKEIFTELSAELKRIKTMSEDEKILMQRTLKSFVKPNYFFDTNKTEKLKEKAIKNIRPIERYIKKGEAIVREGDILNDTSINALRKVGYFNEKYTFVKKSIGYLLLFIFFAIILSLYLYHFNEDILSEEPLVLFVEIMAFITISSFKFFDVLLRSEVHIFVANTNIQIFSVFLFPVAAIAMLVSLVVDSKFAILLSSMLSVIGGLVFADINFVVVAIIGSIVSVYSIMGSKTRAEQMLSGLYLIVTNIALIFALHFINLKFLTVNQDIKFLLRDIMLGFLSGTFSIIFAMGTMPVFEKLFKVTSALRLLELTDLNNLLLKTLLEQAPGTYHHSIMVANLAEAAALEIGGDSLLARIGGYYHDIGKIKRPFFFAENLMGTDNQHDDLNPNLSAIIIISHTKDGIEIAKEHNLPEEVMDIIVQHHGTTLVQYFYKKAKEELGDAVKESQYRYPGPKPQTKEAALVMLADSIESATRSMTRPSPSSIDNLIKKITNDKFIDEQFDECNLTLKEIEKIRNVFSRVLLQMFHKRIEYPEHNVEGQKILK